MRRRQVEDDGTDLIQAVCVKPGRTVDLTVSTYQIEVWRGAESEGI